MCDNVVSCQSHANLLQDLCICIYNKSPSIQSNHQHAAILCLKPRIVVSLLKLLKDISQKIMVPRRFRVLEENFGERRERRRIL
jgi:hypothetical protein